MPHFPINVNSLFKTQHGLRWNSTLTKELIMAAPTQMFLWDSAGVLLPFSKYWWNFKLWKSSGVFINSLWESKCNMIDLCWVTWLNFPTKYVTLLLYRNSENSCRNVFTSYEPLDIGTEFLFTSAAKGIVLLLS